MLALIFLSLYVVADKLAAWNDPDVMADVRSDAVVLTLADTVDLIRSVRPRLGLARDGLPFTGLRISTDGLEQLFRKFTPPDSASVDTAAAALLTAFDVTPGCAIQLETTRQPWLPLTVVHAGTATECVVQAEVRYGDVRRRGRRTVSRVDTVTRTEAFGVTLLTGDTLHFRGIPIRAVAFTTRERGPVESAVRSGQVRFPYYPTRTESLSLGDSLSLGPINGTVIELKASEALNVVVRGVVQQPTVNGRQLRPSLREELQNSRIFSIFLGAFTLLVTFALPLIDTAIKWRNPAAATAPAQTGRARTTATKNAITDTRPTAVDASPPGSPAPSSDRASAPPAALLIAFVITGAMLASRTPPLHAQGAPPMPIAHAVPGTVAIRAGAQQGFGFIAGLRRDTVFIATALHVVGALDGDTQVCFAPDASRCARGALAYIADAIGALPALDLAFVAVALPPGVAWRPDVMAPAVRAGDAVRTIGRAGEWYVPPRAGTVVAIDATRGTLEYNGLDVTTGVSGAPVVSSAGIVGMHTQGLGGARAGGIPLTAIRARLERFAPAAWALREPASCVDVPEGETLRDAPVIVRFLPTGQGAALDAATRLGCIGAAVELVPLRAGETWPGGGVRYPPGELARARALQGLLTVTGRLPGVLGERGTPLEVRIP
jgi:hypothetical protein